jgi:hydroxymethylpyrimidine/phosphomethylpyrimidine kinase
MVSSSGHDLVDDDAALAMINDLFPVAFLITPNVPEAKKLLRAAKINLPEEQESLDYLKGLAVALLSFPVEYVLLKGGHLPLSRGGRTKVCDVLVSRDQNEPFLIENDFKKHNSDCTHGTGCSLASKTGPPPKLPVQAKLW